MAGVRVLEIGNGAAVSILGMLLADQGAEVTKVVQRAESPNAVERAEHHVWNRGKKVLLLDQQPQTEEVPQLASRTDAVVAGDDLTLTTGAAHYRELQLLRRDLIYCHLPPLPGGKAFDGADADPLVGALLAVHQRNHSDSTPTYNPLRMPSVLAAARAAAAVTASIAARTITGEGQFIEVSLYEAMLTAWGRHLVKMGEQEDIGVTPKLPLLEQYLAADGRYVQLHGNFETRWSRILLQVAGHPEYIDEAARVVRSLDVDMKVQSVWRDRIASYIRERPAEEWERELNAAGGAAAVSRRVDEWLMHDHAREAGIVTEAESPFGLMRQPGVAVNVERPSEIPPSPHCPRQLAARTAGQRALPLFGIRVLDLTILIAGPMCGRALAELGADVIKIDDPHRYPSIHSWMDTNRGKKSLLLDLKTADGRGVLWKLLETADVVVGNYRKGKLAKLGLSFDDVALRRPDIIYVSLNAYGDKGPWSDRAGWEQIVQASSGLQVRRAGRERRPVVVTPWICDYTAGLLAAYGVTVALRDQLRSPGPRHVKTSLAASAALVQAQYFFDYAGYERRDVEGESLGESALLQLYEARDGWIMVDATTRHGWDALVSIAEFAPLASDPRFHTAGERAVHDSELTRAISEILVRRCASEWLEDLAKHRIAAVPRVTLDELRSTSTLTTQKLLVTTSHSVYGSVRYTDPRIRWQDCPSRDLGPASAPGQDSVQVLLDAGYSREDVNTLIANEVVAIRAIRESA